MKTVKKKKAKKKDLDIDIFDLDLLLLEKHCLEQPRLVITRALELAEAKDKARRFKSELEVCQAETAKKIRKDPEEHGLKEKPTVGAVAEAVAMDDNVEQYRDLELQALHDIDVLQAFMNALEHRKRALEGLIALHGQGYFAKPTNRISQKSADKLKNQS